MVMKIRGVVKHKISWCYKCGWVHDTVDMYRVEENGKLMLRPLCKDCRNKLENKVVCAVCGEKDGNNLYPTTIERKNFDEGNTCNVIILLCETCRKIPQEQILAKLKIPEMCGGCTDRFECFTAKHDEPQASVLNRKGFYINPKTGRW
jgi:hypothetical protein